jgi:hypothetical protein
MQAQKPLFSGEGPPVAESCHFSFRKIALESREPIPPDAAGIDLPRKGVIVLSEPTPCAGKVPYQSQALSWFQAQIGF